MMTMTDSQAYTRGMIDGDIDACIAIEQRNDLYGYPPSLVSVGLTAIEHGNDPYEAIDAFVDAAYDEMIEGDEL